MCQVGLTYDEPFVSWAGARGPTTQMPHRGTPKDPAGLRRRYAGGCPNMGDTRARPAVEPAGKGAESRVDVIRCCQEVACFQHASVICMC